MSPTSLMVLAGILLVVGLVLTLLKRQPWGITLFGASIGLWVLYGMSSNPAPDSAVSNDSSLLTVLVALVLGAGGGFFIGNLAGRRGDKPDQRT